MYMDTSLYNVLVSCSYTSTNIQASPTIRVFDLFESTLNVLVRLNGSSYMIDIFFLCSSLSNIFISRLILSRSTYSSPEERRRASQSGRGSDLHFATNSFLGNIGAPVDMEGADCENF